MNKGLIIFAREPVPGRVKTRLAREVGDQTAAELYAAMTRDVLDTTAALVDVRRMLFWAAENNGVPPANDYPGLDLFPQQGNTLGDRMFDAFTRAFQGGPEACCIIGTDSPDLPLEHIVKAFDLLDREDIDAVFGPAEDGGYYLLGLKQAWEGFFDFIPWSTRNVLDSSLERSRHLGLRTALLPEWYDIDTRDDLLRLIASGEDSAPAVRRTARRLLRV